MLHLQVLQLAYGWCPLSMLLTDCLQWWHSFPTFTSITVSTRLMSTVTVYARSVILATHWCPLSMLHLQVLQLAHGWCPLSLSLHVVLFLLHIEIPACFLIMQHYWCNYSRFAPSLFKHTVFQSMVQCCCVTVCSRIQYSNRWCSVVVWQFVHAYSIPIDGAVLLCDSLFTHTIFRSMVQCCCVTVNLITIHSAINCCLKDTQGTEGNTCKALVGIVFFKIIQCRLISAKQATSYDTLLVHQCSHSIVIYPVTL